MLTDCSIEEARRLGQQIVESLSDPIALSMTFEPASVSVGIAHHELGSRDLALLRRADIALYEAKRAGGNQYPVLDNDLERRSVVKADVSRSFETASFADEFHLAFQPIVDAETHEPRFVEALARWTSPVHGVVPPDRFIPLAENSGRIVELGEWVLNEALAALASWRSDGLAQNLCVSVNVSAYQLFDDRFIAKVIELLNIHQIAPDSLVVELTESALVVNDERVLSQLADLRSLGCHIACDDFGSGYSNLGQLLQLPLSLIKVDRQLLMALDGMRDELVSQDSPQCAVMSAIASIGETMRAVIVAEGVETCEQATALYHSGVELLQGYLFSRPLGADACRQFIFEAEAKTEPTGQPVGVVS